MRQVTRSRCITEENSPFKTLSGDSESEGSSSSKMMSFDQAEIYYGRMGEYFEADAGKLLKDSRIKSSLVSVLKKYYFKDGYV